MLAHFSLESKLVCKIANESTTDDDVHFLDDWKLALDIHHHVYALIRDFTFQGRL